MQSRISRFWDKMSLNVIGSETHWSSTTYSTYNNCARGDTICPRPLYAAAQLQPIPYACGANRALLPIAVGVMNINDLMNINDVCESATIFPRSCKLTFDLLTLKVVSESCVTWATCANFGLPRPLCSRVIPDVRDRHQTYVRQKHRLMPPPTKGRGIIMFD